MMDIFIQSLYYIIHAPNFWGAMGFTTAIGMFVGAMIFDGELTQAGKGIVSILSYVTMLLWVTVSRVNETLGTPPYKEGARLDMAYAGTMTTIVVTIAWILGVFLGVLLFRLKYKGAHHG